MVGVPLIALSEGCFMGGFCVGRDLVDVVLWVYITYVVSRICRWWVGL
jgi:hypothetical protein